MSGRDESAAVSLRDKFYSLLTSESEERELILSLLTADERRALNYKFVTVPSVARVDPNRIPDPPFPDQEMKRLLKSAYHEILDHILGGILDDEPSMLL